VGVGEPGDDAVSISSEGKGERKEVETERDEGEDGGTLSSSDGAQA
jgi:hypothetical protein